MNGLKIQEVLEELYPSSYAEKWDNVGLQVGSLDKEITGVLVSLDLTMEVIEEAINEKANLIICHHPAIFTPIKQIDIDTYLGRMIQTLIKKDITLYVMHTNYDVSPVGMNMILARKLGLSELYYLDPIDENYGLGVVGAIPSTNAETFINEFKKRYNLDTLKYVGDLDQKVHKVAILGGSGTSHMIHALNEKVDLFITGDVTYHKALDSLNLGLNILDIGHHFEIEGIKELKTVLVSNGIDTPIINSKVETNPYKMV